jgi:hypothetical protein
VSEHRLVLGGAAALVRRDAELFASYRLRFASQFLMALFSVVFFYYVSRLIRVGDGLSPEAWFGSVIVGVLVLELLSASLTVAPGTLRQELLAGTFERIAVSALGPQVAVAAMAAFPTLLAIAVGLVTVALATLGFGLDLDLPRALLALPAGVLVVIAFLPFNLLVSAALLVVKQAAAPARPAAGGARSRADRAGRPRARRVHGRAAARLRARARRRGPPRPRPRHADGVLTPCRRSA